MRHQHSHLIALAVATALLPAGAVAAVDHPFYFELELEQQRIPLAGGTRLEANSFDLVYREFVSEGIGLELRLGRLGAEHEKDSVALDFDPSGYYAGLGFNSRTVERHRLQAGVELDYSYYDSSESLAGQTLELNWTQAEARLWATVRLSSRFKLYGCLFALSIDGEQDVQGTMPQSFDNADDVGQCGGLMLETDERGVVGIEASGGARQGGRIYFGKYFW